VEDGGDFPPGLLGLLRCLPQSRLFDDAPTVVKFTAEALTTLCRAAGCRTAFHMHELEIDGGKIDSFADLLDVVRKAEYKYRRRNNVDLAAPAPVGVEWSKGARLRQLGR
jgi:hypothetical protein